MRTVWFFGRACYLWTSTSISKSWDRPCVMFVKWQPKSTKEYMYKCVGHSEHNKFKGACAKCAHSIKSYCMHLVSALLISLCFEQPTHLHVCVPLADFTCHSYQHSFFSYHLAHPLFWFLHRLKLGVFFSRCLLAIFLQRFHWIVKQENVMQCVIPFP